VVHCRGRETQAPEFIRSQLTLVHIPHDPFIIPFSLILMLSSHLRLDFISSLLSSGFPTTSSYQFIISPMRATCHTHISLLDVTTAIIFDEEFE
jgi:hypothetical protein